jgi:hypothetical protein
LFGILSCTITGQSFTLFQEHVVQSALCWIAFIYLLICKLDSFSESLSGANQIISNCSGQYLRKNEIGTHIIQS